MQSRPLTISFYRRPDNARARQWETRLKVWLGKHASSIRIVKSKADMVLVLGGDGTILQAAREQVIDHTVIFGINLGTVGFLASVRQERHFLKALKRVLAGQYHPVRRMMMTVSVRRGTKNIVQTTALNEAYIQNSLGMVRLNVLVNNNSIQEIHGTGMLVATPTGSTGYNLSAHGPIVDPALHCFIITEILDHNVPTPSIVVPTDDAIVVRVEDFRKEVILACDGQVVLPLKKNDQVIIKKSERFITIAEIESNYFYKSLHEKFSIS